MSSTSSSSSSTLPLPDTCDDQGVRSSCPTCLHGIGLARTSGPSSTVPLSGSHLPARPAISTSPANQGEMEAPLTSSPVRQDTKPPTSSDPFPRLRLQQAHHYTFASSSGSTSPALGSPTPSETGLLDRHHDEDKENRTDIDSDVAVVFGGVTPPVSTVETLLEVTLNAVGDL